VREASLSLSLSLTAAIGIRRVEELPDDGLIVDQILRQVAQQAGLVSPRAQLRVHVDALLQPLRKLGLGDGGVALGAEDRLQTRTWVRAAGVSNRRTRVRMEPRAP
jgi:hypothetical protein